MPTNSRACNINNMEHKHIDPEPDRRYIIRSGISEIDSATVIDATDRHVRLHWDGSGNKIWYRYEDFLPMPDTGRYLFLQILEELETPQPPKGRHTLS